MRLYSRIEITPESRSIAAMDPNARTSLTLIEGLFSPLRRLNSLKAMINKFYKVNICDGYCLGRHLNATFPFSTPSASNASAEHLYARSGVLLFSLR